MVLGCWGPRLSGGELQLTLEGWPGVGASGEATRQEVCGRQEACPKGLGQPRAGCHTIGIASCKGDPPAESRPLPVFYWHPAAPMSLWFANSCFLEVEL